MDITARQKARKQNILNRAIKIIERYKEVGDEDIPDSKIFLRTYPIIVNHHEGKTCIRDEFNISLKHFRTILGWNLKKMQEEIDRM